MRYKCQVCGKVRGIKIPPGQVAIMIREGIRVHCPFCGAIMEAEEDLRCSADSVNMSGPMSVHSSSLSNGGGRDTAADPFVSEYEPEKAR